MNVRDHWSRRDVVVAAAVAATGSVLGCGPDADRALPGVADDSTPVTFRTRLCDVLGIEYPILQAPMSRIVTPKMVAAVCNAGGLGIYAGIGVPPDTLQRTIAEIRLLTDRPFGVNLIMHTALLEPADPASVPPATLATVQNVLNRMRRELGVAESLSRPEGFPDIIDEAVEVILEERVPVFSVGLGAPTAELVGRCHERGMKVVAMAATVEDAVELSESGVDAIAAQGSDAGGHRSTWVKRSSPDYASIGTFSLVPQVVDAVEQPVIAAGGITDGRGLMAAIALGATGALMGTRFIATAESAAPEFHKRALVERSSDDTVLSDAFTGLYARVIRNRYSEAYRESGAPVLPAGMQQLAIADIVNASTSRGSADFYPLYAGQGIGMISTVPSAAEIVEGIVLEASAQLRRCADRLTT